MSRNTLVTGAAGFLGSHLCDALLSEGDIVVGVDNLSTGNLANLSHLSRESRFSLVEFDICKPCPNHSSLFTHTFHAVVFLYRPCKIWTQWSVVNLRFRALGKGGIRA
ncbi:GDP-mannose 4,6-dehydratase [Tunturiibacter gelidiferens]|uniref:GDP-mannose 4,6-dehydratase n=1 Tax=Tunturiibacter gelidiferens TaxID=3069689 RepID=UPI003D9B2436